MSHGRRPSHDSGDGQDGNDQDSQHHYYHHDQGYTIVAVSVFGVGHVSSATGLPLA